MESERDFQLIERTAGGASGAAHLHTVKTACGAETEQGGKVFGAEGEKGGEVLCPALR